MNKIESKLYCTQITNYITDKHAYYEVISVCMFLFCIAIDMQDI